MIWDCEYGVNVNGYVDYEKVIRENMEYILDMAMANVSDSFDGVVQMEVDTGILTGCSMSTNEVENPANRMVEVYRLEQGFVPEECAECIYCEDFDDCDSHDGSERCYDCCIENLSEDFLEQFDDIVGGVLAQIEEWGYDLN